MPTADINGTALHYERRGAGEPLLLIQGMGGHSLHWGEPFLTKLAQDFEVVVFDNRGIGRSGGLAGEFTIADLAQDALALLDALEIERAHVVGISMGGMIAQELALAAPKRILTLTLGATYCGGPDGRLTEQAVVMEIAGALLSGEPERVIRTGWEVNVSPDFAGTEENFAVFAAVAAQYPTPMDVLMAQLQAIGTHDTSARLTEIQLPTLVVHGSADRMLDVSNGEQIAGLIPAARLEIIDGVGHLFFWEAPERAAELVREHALGAAQ